VIHSIIDLETGTVLAPEGLRYCILTRDQDEAACNSDSAAKELAEKFGRPLQPVEPAKPKSDPAASKVFIQKLLEAIIYGRKAGFTMEVMESGFQHALIHAELLNLTDVPPIPPEKETREENKEV